MRAIFFTALALAFCVLTDSASAGIITTGPIEWEVANGGNGHFYELVLPDNVDSNFTWEAAKVAAETRELFGANGHLVTVTSFAEDEFVRTIFGSQLVETFVPQQGPIDTNYAWIGLTDNESFGGTEAGNDPNGGWHWVTGEAFSYTNWGPTEPHHGGQNEFDYVHYWDRGSWSWNDDANEGWEAALDRNVRYGFIVEYEGPFSPVPEPTSLATLGGLVSLFGLGYLRRRRKQAA